MTRHPIVLLAALAMALPLPAPARDAAAETATTPSTRHLYLLLIQQARSDGRPRAALAYLDDYDGQHPGDLDARLLRINCLLDLGQVDAARKALAKLPAGTREGEISAVRGHVFAAQGAWNEAAAQYVAARAANPANPLTGNALGYAQLRAGRPAEAVETLKGARDLAPRNAVIRNNLLLALTMAGRAGEAEATFGAIADAGARDTLRRQIAAQSARLWGATEARP